MKIKTLISILLLVCTSCAFFVPGDGMIFISGRIKKLDLTESKIDELNCVIELYLAEKKDIIYASKTLSLSRGKFKTSFIVSQVGRVTPAKSYRASLKCSRTQALASAVRMRTIEPNAHLTAISKVGWVSVA